MIIVSGGHYPGKSGASFEGFSEYPETLVWAQEICNQLNAMCMPCVIVPTGGLTKKVQFINDAVGKGAVWLALEVHFNAGGGQGTETLYCPGSEKGERYAEQVNNALWPVFGKSRGVKEGWYRMDKASGIIDYFLRATKCPAIIIEPEFVEYYKDIQAKRVEACTAIAEAIYGMFYSNL